MNKKPKKGRDVRPPSPEMSPLVLRPSKLRRPLSDGSAPRNIRMMAQRTLKR